MSSEAAIYDPGTLPEPEDAELLTRLKDRIASPTRDDPQPVPLLKVDLAIEALDDDSLLERLRDSDREALAVLFRRYARAVRSIALRILRSESEADDLVQDVFLFLFQKPSTFNRSRGSGRTWVLYIAYNRALDRRKYLNSRHFYTNQEFEEELFESPAGSRERPFHGSQLEEVLGRDIDTALSQKLSNDQLETIRLHFAEGLTLREISEIMGQSLVNVRNFYYRGLERIRKTILPATLRSK
jgi:RNA polymerase sigma-70 factor (ECF subfamily)